MIRIIAVALLLMTGSWVPGEDVEPEVRISVENWGEQIVLGEPGAVAFAHLAATGPDTRVTVTITPGREGLHGFAGRLTAPDAYGGEVLRYCGDEYRRIESAVVCTFEVPMTRGVNRLVFDLQSASFGGMRTTEAEIVGGSLSQVTVIEARAPDGSWVPITDRGAALPGATTSELRYRIMNFGDIPFRVTSSCQPGGTVWPGQQLACVLRGARPGYALTGTHAVEVRLEDPVGGGAAYTVEARVQPAFREKMGR